MFATLCDAACQRGEHCLLRLCRPLHARAWRACADNCVLHAARCSQRRGRASVSGLLGTSDEFCHILRKICTVLGWFGNGHGVRRVDATNGETTLLCCPEDTSCPEHVGSAETLCPDCSVPICRSCVKAFLEAPGKPPPLALSNDLWTSYIPEEVVTHGASVLELIAASPVTTT